MSALMSNSTGNFTSAATWSLIESTTFPQTIAVQETGTTASTTTFVSGSSFVGINATSDGIALKISTRIATGGFSVRLAIAGLPVANTTVAVNVTDIPLGIGWVFFKFTAPVNILAASTYTVQIISSTASQVTLFRKSATAGDWTYALRTTTTQAPAAGDQLITAGELTLPGSSSAFTVTMDNTTSTLFGPAVAGAAALEVNSNSTLQYGTSASTNYNLRLAGSVYINNMGTLTIGTGAIIVPSTSTAKLEIVGVSNVQYGIEVRSGSIFKSGGSIITNNALLAADATIAATSLTTNVATGWKSGDVIAFASTTRTRTEAESKALTANAVGTTLTVAALTNAHSGSSPTQGELINLTRNVKIFGTSNILNSYINIISTSTVDLQSTEIYQMGSATFNKRGLDIGTTTGTCVMNNCSVHDNTITSAYGIYLNSTANNNTTISNCVIYNTAAQGIFQTATAGTNNILNQIIVIAAAQNAVSSGISLLRLNGTVTNLTATSCQGVGILLTDSVSPIFGTINNLVAHSNSTVGIQISSVIGQQNNPMASFTNLTSWRNATIGIVASNSFTFIADTVTAFGNTTSNLALGTLECGNIVMKNMTINAGAVLACPIGVDLVSDMQDVYIDNSTFGNTSTHATADMRVGLANIFDKVVIRNTTLNSTTQIGTPSNLIEGSFISLAKLNTIAGNHKTFKKYGIITPDTVIFNKGTPSTRLTPNNAVQKLQGGIKKVAVPSGQTVTINVFVRKSVIGDGTTYNGTQPTLVLKMDSAIGITSDMILATADNTYNGTFKVLTATTPVATDDAVFQFSVDCDGTAGWVNVDDWSVNN